MRIALRASIVIALSFGVMACGSSHTSAQKEGKTSNNQLVVQELDIPVGGLTALDLIKQYRSHWLWSPETESLKNDPQIQVYVNNPGSNAGSVPALKRINADNVSEIKHFPPNEAQFRFGMGNSIGAILVTTKSGR
jgi:hypothetical protein